MSEIFYLFNYFIRQTDRIIPILMPENEKILKIFLVPDNFLIPANIKA